MRMSKWFVFLLLFALCLSAVPAKTQAQTQEIQIFLDGKPVHSDVSPYILPQANVTMVPLRVISESLGADVFWDNQSQTAVISKDGTVIALTINQPYAVVNNFLLPLDASVQNRQNRTMVPLRFVSEQLGLQVGWDQATRTITLSSGGNSAPAETETDPVVAPDVQAPFVQEPVVQEPAVQTPAPAQPQNRPELRGVWISTVYNLDWPSASAYGNAEKQKQEYVQLLNELQAMGMNAVFVQVRPAADALYPSSLVPWSKFLTGTQGKDPGYDPLAFMIEETHRRGMQFHAWFNPFRATTDAKLETLAANHVAIQHPEWLVKSDGKYYINPGIPAARQHIIDAIMEVVNRYDIDGVHLDDYFYPYNGGFPDDAAYQAYGSASFASKADWRRYNINQFVQSLHQSIKSVKPEVQFGISPFGVWRNIADDPTGSDTRAGVTAYDTTYADVRTWIRHGWIDYVTPQIYWSLSFERARYDKLVTWWANEVRGTDVALYIGHAPYKLGTAEAGWQNAQEIINQLKYNRQFSEVKGSIFFSAKDLRKNPLGLIQELKNYYSSR